MNRKKLSQITDASIYPYKNLSLVDMDGEIWKPVPGSEEYYLISNKGRIKTIPRQEERTLQGITIRFWTKEKICLQNVEIKYNTYLNQKRVNLRFCGKLGNKFSPYVSRLVYAAFAGKIHQDTMIMHRDNDRYNNRIENLYPVSDKKIIAKYRLNPITQYDREGNPLQIFESIHDASLRLNINANSIALVIRGERITAGGYLFRKGSHRKKIDVSGLGVYRQMKRANASLKIARYDREGNLTVYLSLKDALIQNKCSKRTLKKCLNGEKDKVKLSHIRQYEWKYADIFPKTQKGKIRVKIL